MFDNFHSTHLSQIVQFLPAGGLHGLGGGLRPAGHGQTVEERQPLVRSAERRMVSEAVFNFPFALLKLFNDNVSVKFFLSVKLIFLKTKRFFKCEIFFK